MIKTRGFEKISLDQWLKDIPKWESYVKESTESPEDLYDYVKFPRRATQKSAGYDIYATFGIRLAPGEEVLIPTGMKAYMLKDEFLGIYPRSGLGFKFFLRLANTVGVIDSDYYNNATNEGHIFIKMRNESSANFIDLPLGTAIAQGIFTKFLIADDDDPELAERRGGLGSTTKQ